MAEIESAKLELIEKTNMVDYAVDIYQTLNQTEDVSQFPARAVAGGAARGWRPDELHGAWLPGVPL